MIIRVLAGVRRPLEGEIIVAGEAGFVQDHSAELPRQIDHESCNWLPLND